MSLTLSALSEDEAKKRDILIKRTKSLLHSVNATYNAMDNLSLDILAFIGEHEDKGDLGSADRLVLNHRFNELQNKMKLWSKTEKKIRTARAVARTSKKETNLLAKIFIKELENKTTQQTLRVRTKKLAKATSNAIAQISTENIDVNILNETELERQRLNNIGTDLAVSLEDL